jgi:hypothetical protein
MLPNKKIVIHSYSYFETNFFIFSAFGTENKKIGLVGSHFVFLKPLLGLAFNPQKCANTFVDWYYLRTQRLRMYNRLGHNKTLERIKYYIF